LSVLSYKTSELAKPTSGNQDNLKIGTDEKNSEGKNMMHTLFKEYLENLN
jgi:hypothetical protein